MTLILYSADLSSELSLTYADGGIRAGFLHRHKIICLTALTLTVNLCVIRPQRFTLVLSATQ